MALLIAFIASFNLCLGYVLGVYIGVLPGVAPRRDFEPADDDPIALSPPPTPEPAVAPPTYEPAPPRRTEPERTPPPSDGVVPSQTASNPPEATSTEYASILEGLEAFKTKLGTVNAKTNDTPSDKEAIDECAGELKDANTEYLEKASVAIDKLGSDEAAQISAEQRELRDSLSVQSDEVRQANDQIDEILTCDSPAEARERLLKSSAQLASSTAKVEQAVPVAASGRRNSSLDTPQLVPTLPSEFRRMEDLLDMIDESLAEEARSAPLQVGIAVLPADSEVTGRDAERLLAGIGHIVAQELAVGQSAAIDDQGRLVLLLHGDDEAGATTRCERIRQQVDVTTFRRDQEQIRTSVLCAVADDLKADSRDDVLRRLTESVEEAGRAGENRTFHHDGRLAAPVTPQPFDVKELEIEI